MVDCEPGVPAVSCEPARLNQAISGLLQNAIEAVSGRGNVEVSVRGSGNGVEVCVEDDGCGIPDEARSRVLEFNFTSKGGRMRLGLGLPTCKKVVEELGGSIELGCNGERGTRVILRLPAAETPEAPPSGP